MGVPKFYRFISERFPLINAPLSPPSRTPPKIDNLYLDMNGIIHNCVRSTPGNGGLDSKRYSSSLAAPKTQQQIFLDVFKYIDNIVALANPSVLLYMAIDGVAPRAKMNQQRARRFRSAKERLDEHNRQLAEDPMYAAAAQEPFDSNCITPGTAFMQALTSALHYFVAKKITEDTRWGRLEVILSGAEAPGEGEHKIMEHIRAHRESGRMPPNARHCVYGQDADLIMLGLVTHEPHFFILREKVDYSANWKRKGGPRVATDLDTTVFGEFELLSIGVLREYLALEIGAHGNSSLPFFDVERVTDDFVFILMLIGNDFMPNLPTLDIADGTLNVLLHLYKRMLPLMGGFLTNSSKIVAERLEYFFAQLSMLEKTVMRSKLEEQSGGRRRRGGGRNGRGASVQDTDLDQLFGLNPQIPGVPSIAMSSDQLLKEAANIRAIVNDAELQEMKQVYYAQKFGSGFGSEGSPGFPELTQGYVEGIWWTLRYYTEGCRHWRWFYPFHYAPLASDISDVFAKLQLYSTKFVADQPFQPFEQLLSVLPPVSSWCLPKPFRALMTNPSSPIREQYPDDFGIDLNGKRNDWEAVVLLPFVDEEQLLQAMASISTDLLTESELKRNCHGPSFSYRFSPKWSEEQDSPFKPQLPPITSRAKKIELRLPEIPEGQAFSTDPLPGTLLPCLNDALADLPFLGEFEHEGLLYSAGVNVFGNPSKNQSLILKMGFSSDKKDLGGSNDFGTRSILEQKGVSPGDLVWFGYPWRTAGTVECISNASETKRASASGRSFVSGTAKVEVKPMKKSAFDRDALILTSSLLQKGGIVISNPSELAVVRADEDPVAPSSPDKDSESRVTLCDPHFITPRAISTEARMESGTKTEALHDGQSVLYVGGGGYFGHLGIAHPASNSDLVKVEFQHPSAAGREPAFGYRVVNISTSNQRWLTLSKLASEVGISVPIADAFLGSIRVRLQSAKEEIDLGLGIKYVARGLYIPGYARTDQKQYYSFSERTVDLLRRYRAAFPHLFSTVQSCKQEEAKGGNGRTRGSPVYSTRDLFGNTKKADDAARAASTWISVQEVARLPLVSANAEVLAKGTIRELEKHGGIIRALQKEFIGTLGQVSTAKRTIEVTRHSVLTGSEGVQWSLEDGQGGVGVNSLVSADGSGLRLGDRIVNRIGAGGLPFGLRGTVVGIHYNRGPEIQSPAGRDPLEGTRGALVEVVFDEGFIGGSNLNGRCLSGRGKAVPAQTLFVIRPDRDNTYYSKNYARIAARTAIVSKRFAADERKLTEKSDAVARASVLTYAGAVQKSATVAAKGHVSAVIPGVVPMAGGRPAASMAVPGVVAPIHPRVAAGPLPFTTFNRKAATATPATLPIPPTLVPGHAAAGQTAVGGKTHAVGLKSGNAWGQAGVGGGKNSGLPINAALLPVPTFATGKGQRQRGRGGRPNGMTGAAHAPAVPSVVKAKKSSEMKTEAEVLAEMVRRDLGVGEVCLREPAPEAAEGHGFVGAEWLEMAPEADAVHGVGGVVWKETAPEADENQGGVDEIDPLAKVADDEDDFVQLWNKLQSEAHVKDGNS